MSRDPQHTLWQHRIRLGAARTITRAVLLLPTTMTCSCGKCLYSEG